VMVVRRIPMQFWVIIEMRKWWRFRQRRGGKHLLPRI
jgi:hypothetical protein